MHLTARPRWLATSLHPMHITVLHVSVAQPASRIEPFRRHTTQNRRTCGISRCAVSFRCMITTVFDFRVAKKDIAWVHLLWNLLGAGSWSCICQLLITEDGWPLPFVDRDSYTWHSEQRLCGVYHRHLSVKPSKFNFKSRCSIFMCKFPTLTSMSKSSWVRHLDI